MKLVYVAGPFRATNSWEIEQNIRRAETLALEVWKAGAACICPHANTRYFQGSCLDNVWLEGDLEMVRRCDALLMVPGWQNSVGSVAEHALAKSRGILIFTSLMALQMWLSGMSNVCWTPENSQSQVPQLGSGWIHTKFDE